MTSKPILFIAIVAAIAFIAGGVMFATTRETPPVFLGGASEPDSLLPQAKDGVEAVSLATETPTGTATSSAGETDSDEPILPPEGAGEEPVSQEPTPQPQPQPTPDIREPSEPAPKPKTRSSTHTVSIGSSSFVPQLLTIYAGDKVCWVNNDTQLHWPASDPHPTHTGLPDFDPLADLLPGETFCYTFKELGVISYHDHTQAVINDVATITGGIRVVLRE